LEGLSTDRIGTNSGSGEAGDSEGEPKKEGEEERP